MASSQWPQHIFPITHGVEPFMSDCSDNELLALTPKRTQQGLEYLTFLHIAFGITKTIQQHPYSSGKAFHQLRQQENLHDEGHNPKHVTCSPAVNDRVPLKGQMPVLPVLRQLLLKRAAHDAAFPNMFAIPGGHVEDSDKDILHALKREVLEETALVVRAVNDQTEPLAWTTERPTSGNGDSAETGPRSVQSTFVCDVEGDGFRVDPMEHSLGVWADDAEAEKLEMKVRMREAVKNAFEWKKAMMRENLKV